MKGVYDFLTVFWASVFAVPTGLIVYSMASSQPQKAWIYGGAAAVSAAVLVFIYREVRRPK